MLRYLIDENISPKYRTQLLYHKPSLTVMAIGDDGAPARSTLDPEILKWCEQHNFILVTNDISSQTRYVRFPNHCRVPNAYTAGFCTPRC